MKGKKMKVIQVLLIMLFSFLATPILYATASLAEISEHYRTAISHKESGVYEYKDFLYFQAVVPCEKNSTMDQLRAKSAAMLMVKDEIKKWMLEYSASERSKDVVTLSSGETFVKSRLDEMLPEWQFVEFEVAFKQHVLCNRKVEKQYVYCVCAEKTVVINNIPKSFYESCSAKKVLETIKVRAQRVFASDARERFLTECGAFDLLGANVSGGSRDAYLLVNEKIRKHLEQSDFAKELKQAIIEAETPQVTVKEVEEVNEAKTLSIKRVETVTVTHNPRMQKLFLNWETEENFPLPTTSLGETTKKNLFRGKTSVVDSIQHLKTALIENPGDKELWNYLGRKLMDNGEPLLAIIAYRNALKLDPTFIYPMVNLANAYLSINQYDLAFGLATALQGMELDSWSAKESVRILQTDCEASY